MPNHIQTQVEISGKEQAIKKLIEDTKIKLDTDAASNEFDFNGIIPMPKELHETTSPCTIVATQEEADQKNAEDREVAKKNGYLEHYTDRYLSQAESDRRMKEYGANNWYDFAHLYWGTKWNAYEVRYITHELNGDNSKLVLELSTAWCTPQGIWDKLEEQGFTVKGVYYGEMDGYAFIGDGEEVFEAYQNVEVDYVG